MALLEDRYRASEEQVEEGDEPGVLAPQEAKFNKLRELALDSAIEIMSLKLDPDHKSFDKLLARKTTISAAVMTTTVRVDAGILRARVRDRVEELLEAVREAETKAKH